MNTVVVAGEIYTDLILGGFEYWPQPGEEVFARDFRRELGGGAAITACGLATLGTATTVFGIDGADHHDWIAELFIAHGVDTSALLVHPHEPTGFTVAVSTPQERTFLSYTGANRGFPRTLRESAEAGRFAGVRHIHLAYAPPWNSAAALFEAIHANGCTLSLDAGWHEPWLTDPRALELLSLVDLFFPNEPEAARITRQTEPERMLAQFRAAGIREVALKLGPRGSALLRGDEIFTGPPLVVNPVDTTGAGDCFDAGFLHAWLAGQDPAACLRMGNICGALSTEAYGGIEGFPSADRMRREWELPSCEK